MKLSKILAEKDIREIISISEDASIKDAAKMLCQHNIGSLLVHSLVNKQKYIGIISERDIINVCCATNIEGCSNIKVTDIMTKNMIVATVNDDVEYIINIMGRHKIRHIPVLDGNKVIGIVSSGDIINTLHKEDEIKLHHLSDFVGGTYASNVY